MSGISLAYGDAVLITQLHFKKERRLAYLWAPHVLFSAEDTTVFKDIVS